jgi:hypothetical protein
MKQAEQQNQHVEHQKRATGFVQMCDQPGSASRAPAALGFGQAGVGKAQVVPGPEQCKQRGLVMTTSAADGHAVQRLRVCPVKNASHSNSNARA